MSLWKIALRSIQQRKLSSWLTIVSMALGVALVVTVLVIRGQVQQSFTRNASLGYHLVVGGKNGSKLELVFATAFYLSNADEPLPYSYYKKLLAPIAEGGYGDFVALAVPVCLGDSYEGFRVVGTNLDFFDLQYRGDQTYEDAIEAGAGRKFRRSGFFEAVIGADVAERTGLEVGDTFMPTHGVTDDGHVHEDRFTVVGIMDRTYTPNDRVLLINMEGFYLLKGHAKEGEPNSTGVTTPSTEEEHRDDEQESDPHDDAGHDHHGHDHAHHEPLPDEQKQVSAILVLCKYDIVAADLFTQINEGGEAQAAQPVRVITQFLDEVVGPASLLLMGLTILTVIVAGIGIMVAIYNTMASRQHEIAIMRALGARRGTLMRVILLEATILAVVGGLLGWLGGHALVASLSPWVAGQSGVPIGFFDLAPAEVLLQFRWFGRDVQWSVHPELWLIPGLLILAVAAGFLPALSAYRADVSKSLSATP